jgi:hypothetical protein
VTDLVEALLAHEEISGARVLELLGLEADSEAEPVRTKEALHG